MANKIVTPINGITTNSNYQDGDCYSLINLRPKNGALHPVAPRKVMQELSQKYDIVFLHQNNDYKNWIGVVVEEGDVASSIFNDILSDDPKLINIVPNKINGIEQIGNTLSIITSDNIYYMLYKDSEYTFLGNLPDLPVINFSASTQNEITEETLLFKDEYSGASINKSNIEEYAKGLVNKAIDELNKTEHYLTDACFVRYAIRLFDGSLIKHSAPILVMYPKMTTAMKTMYLKSDGTNFDMGASSITVSGYKLKLSYDFTPLSSWSDIIQSVDMFISTPLGLTSLETNISPNILPNTSGEYITIGLVHSDIKRLSHVAEEGNFYFVKSFEIGKKVPVKNPISFPSTDEQIANTEVLVQNERMTDDNFSNHKHGAEISYTYNNRLHLGKIQTTFFNGFSSNYFNWATNQYNGNFSITANNKYISILIEVEINTGNKLEKVYSQYIYDTPSPLFLSAFISYPDTRAKKLTIYGIDENGSLFELHQFNLKPHVNLNLAYNLNNDTGFIKPIYEKKRESINIPTRKSEVSVTDSNKIKVSELNNPLLFPNINTYQVGNGSILAMATNAIRISEGQFGQYPLYIFTTQGIYSLNVGEGEIVYSTTSAPTSYEIPTTPIVASTPFGVVFTSARGICIIRGQEVELLTASLQEAPENLIIEFQKPMEGVIHNFAQKPFTAYLRELDSLVYDSYENELIICDKESDFNYV